MTNPKQIEITDEFTDPNGEWSNYEAIPDEQNASLRNQKHVDIRSFIPDQPASEVTMFLMDRLTMFYLDGEPASNWNAEVEYNPGEVVEIENLKYVSIKAGEGQEPPDAEYWELIESVSGELSRYSHDATPSAKVIVINNEGWTYGTVGPQEDRNNWNGISVACPAGQTTTTQSVITYNS